MIILNQKISAIQLSNLDCANVGIQTMDSSPEKLKAFFDFDPILNIDSYDDDRIWQKISSEKSNSELSFSGWVGFFGYELLAFHFGIPLKAQCDLSVPAGWFGRPQSLIQLEEDHTIIESRSSEREGEIAKLLMQKVTPQAIVSQAAPPTCNLTFKQYKDIFNQAKEAILDGETYQIKISQRFEANALIDPIAAFAK